MLLLASLPPYPGASHDPNQWLDSLMKVAHKSRMFIKNFGLYKVATIFIFLFSLPEDPKLGAIVRACLH